jgi:glycosyltransferase involved in cell wall biosynthesis
MEMFVAEYDTLIERGEPYIGGAETLITVMVTLFNYDRFITSTLDDVAAQTHGCLELVIVDDCSNDNSTSVARTWIEKNLARFGSVRLVRHRLNEGLAQSRNTGFVLAQSEYVFVLDADNGIYPRATARLLEALKVSRQAGAYSQLELFGDRAGVGIADVWDPEQFRHGNYIDAMALVTKSAWAAVGGYSYMDVPGWEDFDFWCKFVRAGLRCVYVPEMLCRYRLHGKSMLTTETNPRVERLCQEMVLRHPWMTFTFNY